MVKYRLTRAARQRHVRVGSYSISEELRIGLIDLSTALARLKELHEEAGFPYDEARERRSLELVKPKGESSDV